MSRAIQEFNKTSSKSDPDKSNFNKNEDSNIQRKGANPPKKRSVLGRGLSALMSPTTVIDIPVAAEQNSQAQKIDLHTELNTASSNIIKTDNNLPENLAGTKSSTKLDASLPLQYLPIDQLQPNPNQPRTSFSQKEIRELATSIRKSGVLQPLLVRKKSNSTSTFASFEIVAGERRWRAAKEAGLITVPAVIKELDDQEALEIGIIENIQRQDLNPIEEAIAYSRLITEFNCTQDQLSQTFGKDRSSIANCIRLLNLPNEIQELIINRKITSGHARALLGIENSAEQIELANILAEEKISVREAEKVVKQRKTEGLKTNSISKIPQNPTSQSDAALEERLRRALGTKVKVNMTASGKGEVRIAFFSRSEFENFMEKLGA